MFQGNPCISKVIDMLSDACLSVSQSRVLLLLIGKAELKSREAAHGQCEASPGQQVSAHTPGKY